MSDAKIDTSLITKAYHNELMDYLTNIKDGKAIVWDQPLISTFEQFTTLDSIKGMGVKVMYFLEEGRPTACKAQNVVFIVRPMTVVMEKVARFVSKVKKDEKPFEMEKKKFHILFVPRKTLVCEKKLKEMEILQHLVSVDELPLGLFPLDEDLASMHMDRAFKECFLDKNFGCLFDVGKSLMFLQSIFGTIQNIIGKGDMADRVINIMLRLKKEMEPHEPDVPPHIDNLIIIDRMVDPVTPLVTQLTYEGLIDELFGITNGKVKLPASRFESDSKQSEKEANNNPFQEEASTNPFEDSNSTANLPEEVKEIQLNSSEQLFAELRDRHFIGVAPFLTQRTKSLRCEADERHDAKSVGDIKKFVSKLPHIQSAKAALHTHITIAGMIHEKVIGDGDFMQWIMEQQEYLEGNDIDKIRPLLEDAILDSKPFLKVLRMICLQCICNDGFKPKMLEFYLRELVQTYGYHHIVTLNNLEKLGLLKAQGQTRNFQTVAKTYKLFLRGGDEKRPDDINYVYSVYAPLSVRLVQLYNKLFWRGMEVTNDILPGKVRTETQPVPSWFQRRDESDDQSRPGSQEQKVTLVFFLGGVTYAEVSALRFLSHHDDSTTKYIVATTNVINGTSWLESISENLRKESLNPFHMIG